MKVLYSCSFGLNGYSGKSRATRQKLNQLDSLVGSLKVICPSTSNSVLSLILLPVIEVRILIAILLFNPNVFVSRGYVGWLSIHLCNLLGIKTAREVHSDCIGEVSLLKESNFKKVIINWMAKIQHYIDRTSDLRIFNHPTLMLWWHSLNGYRKNDIYVYNGYDETAVSRLDKKSARDEFNFNENIKYITFVGSVSSWHGVSVLDALQDEFDKVKVPLQIVVGGGIYTSKSNVINISPLNSKECSDLILASDACLLTVADNRVSPGSPLKLYDYIVNGASVITQKNVLGYSDEVDKASCGISVDFTDIQNAKDCIIDFLENKRPYTIPSNMSWRGRMAEWVAAFEKITHE